MWGDWKWQNKWFNHKKRRKSEVKRMLFFSVLEKNATTICCPSSLKNIQRRSLENIPGIHNLGSAPAHPTLPVPWPRLSWHCVRSRLPCPGHSALWPHAIWPLAPRPPAWALQIKKKKKNQKKTLLPQLIRLCPSEHTGTARLPVGGQARGVSCAEKEPRREWARGQEGTWGTKNKALCNLPFRRRRGRGGEEGGGMFIDLSHTPIVKGNFGTGL